MKFGAISPENTPFFSFSQRHPHFVFPKLPLYFPATASAAHPSPFPSLLPLPPPPSSPATSSLPSPLEAMGARGKGSRRNGQQEVKVMLMEATRK